MSLKSHYNTLILAVKYDGVLLCTYGCRPWDCTSRFCFSVGFYVRCAEIVHLGFVFPSFFQVRCAGIVDRGLFFGRFSGEVCWTALGFAWCLESFI